MRLAALPALALLAACAAEKEPEPTPTPTATVAEPRTLIAADFDPTSLGAQIDIADGDEPYAITAGDAEIGLVTSYVACPKEMTACDPDALPEGTVLTYVYTVTPGGPESTTTPSPGSTATEATQASPALFEMLSPAPGFKGVLGYSRAQAVAALGDENAITVSVDQGRLIWRVTGGSGWRRGMPLTFWWQTTIPPAGLQDVFSLEWDGTTASATAPFPAADKPVDPATDR